LVSAIGSASALAALPEFGGPFSKPFTTMSGVTVLEVPSGERIECVADHGGGEITGPKEGKNAVFAFTGCELVRAGEKIPCTTPGAAFEEIVTTPLVVTLGYITHTPLKTVVGLDFSAPRTVGLWAEALCREEKVQISGSVIGKITPINKVVKALPGHFTLTFSQSKAKQKPTHFEGAPPDVLEVSIGGGPFLPAGLAGKDTLGFPAAEIINA
jgi:hypothetical protein